MIPQFTIALPHTLLLSAYLFLLICCVAKEVNWGYYLVITLIGLECTWNYFFGTGDNLLHSAVDLMAIGAISYLFFLVRKKVLRYLFLAFSLFGFFLWHLNFDASRSGEKLEEQKLDYLIEFDTQENLKTWLLTANADYDLSYPAFSPQDLSFKLDEYVLISLTAAELKAFKTRSPEIKGLIHFECNDEVVLKMPNSYEITSKEHAQGLNDPHLDKQWMADQYKLDKFHKLTEKHKIKAFDGPTVIAILDTGVDGKHEDLKDNFISTASRYDNDPKGHGTHCAGIAAAVTGNKIGIASLIPSQAPVKVTSIKVLNSFGVGTQKTIIDGIIKAADEGCSVISLSLGGITSDSKEKAYAEAVRYANAKGSIVIVAAGNSGKNATGYTPANTEGVITVTAIDTLLRKAHFGNDVSELKMGLAAPGTMIYSTFPGDKYQSFNGTSMAAPFVSGLVGLMKAYNRELTTSQVYTILQKSAIAKNQLFIVDPYAALELMLNQRPES